MTGSVDRAEPTRVPSQDELFTVRVLGVVSDIETQLETCGATGRGLHEKVTSVAGHLPDGIERQLRFIASVRNKLVHESGYRLPERDQARFIETAKAARTALERLQDPGPRVVEARPLPPPTPTPTPTPIERRPLPRVAEERVQWSEEKLQRSSARQDSGSLITVVILAVLLVLSGGAAVPAWHWVTDAFKGLVAAMDASRSEAPATPITRRTDP